MRWQAVRDNWLKAACMSALLISAGMFLGARGEHEIVVPHAPEDDFPMKLGEWSGRRVPIDSQILQILGAGDFVERSYQAGFSRSPVDLFIGYFPTQRTGVSIHSPKNCLPGSGWAPIDSKYVPLPIGGTKHYEVNEYVIEKGEQKELVLYWYQAHGRVVANEYIAKFYLVEDSIRMNRSDAALVRVVTPILGGETASQAEKRAFQFVQVLMPNLDKYIPA